MILAPLFSKPTIVKSIFASLKVWIPTCNYIWSFTLIITLLVLNLGNLHMMGFLPTWLQGSSITYILLNH